jgi:hypothetical protein
MYAHKENVTISTTPVAAAVCEVRKDCLCTIPADIQCCGSVSASGSVCFWASRIRIRIRQSGSGSGSFHHQARILRKNLDFYCFVTSIWLFIFIKNDVNVPMFRIRVPIRIRRIRMHGPPGSATLIVDLWDRTVLINQSINQSIMLPLFCRRWGRVQRRRGWICGLRWRGRRQLWSGWSAGHRRRSRLRQLLDRCRSRRPSR